MTEYIGQIAICLPVFVFAMYGVGLRPSGRLPFLRLAAPLRIFAWAVHGAAKNRLRKKETIRDWFVYREGKEPGPEDLAKDQILFIASFGVVLAYCFIAD
jgi:hypothetical protein